MANYSDIRYVFTGVAEYATADNLPTSGNTTGDQALVTGTNRLYIWNGTGWYNIALINTTPSISGASSAYSLLSDGTATTVTITATDAEGLPITYSIASDTSGNIATVSQGTGSNTNVFTITPSTSTANAGTFSLTFRASDGVNIATAVSSFTLQFSVENSNYTTALITSVGANNAVNNSFDDASTNNHTITANGNVTQDTFSPYRHGGYSTYFDGSGDYLASDNNNIGNFGTDDFTVEGWFYVLDNSNLYTVVDGRSTTLTDASGWSVAINTSGGIYVYTGGFHISGTNGDVSTHTWHHWALTRESGDMKLFLNGTQQGSTNSTARNFTANLFRVGASGTGGEVFKGYQRDVRVVKGTALYTSNFTVPNEPLTAVTNTSFLGCHLPYFADGSTNGHSITVNGDPTIEPFAPYDYETYSASGGGGSIFFDGTSGYVSGDMTADLAFGTDDMTLECWVYPNTISGLDAIFDTRTTSFTGNAFTIQLEDGIPHVYAGSYSNTNTVIEGTSAVKVSTWTHIAFSRSSGTNTLFINGASVATNTNSWDQSFSSTNDWAVGETPPTSTPRYFDGNISDFRIVKGTAVYTSAFTPPTAPLTAITNTSLLLNGTDAGIIDKSQSLQTLTLNNGAVSSTSQYKHLTSSMYFDGDAYIKCDAGSELYGYTGAFTIEAWIYPTSLSQYSNPIFNYGNSGSTGNDHFIIELCGTADSTNSGKLHVRWDSAYPVRASDASDTPLNTWTHIAFTRDSSNNIKLWINGTEEASATKSGAMGTSQADRTIIGSQTYSEGTATRSYTGYISDLRITKGLARYTSNFTAPTAALQG